MKNSQYEHALNRVRVQMEQYLHGGVRLYLTGSGSAAKRNFFNPRLSDLDLLFVCETASLTDYIEHFTQISQFVSRLSVSDYEIVETFFSSSATLKLRFSCLATIHGADFVSNEDLLFGLEDLTGGDVVSPTLSTRKNLYIAQAAHFWSEYARLLPVADTSRARKTSKAILKGFKLLICANSPISELTAIEEQLFSVVKLDQAKIIFESVTGRNIEVDEIIDEALAGSDMLDWPAWMVAQDRIARQLLEFIQDNALPVVHQRVSETVGIIIHETLITKLKNILMEKDGELRSRLIGDYIDDTSSFIVRLALGGVERLYDLTLSSIPTAVQDSYRLITDHYKHGTSDFSTLAAATVLLEFAVTESLVYMNKSSKSS